MVCEIGQGTSYTYCVATDANGNSYTCYDNSGNQVMQDRTEGDIECPGLYCYDDDGATLVGVCKEEEDPGTLQDIFKIFPHRKIKDRH